MSRVNCQLGLLALYTMVAACDGRPGLLGEYVAAIGAKHKAATEVDAGAAPEPSAGAAAPSTPATDPAPPPNASSSPTTPTPPQPTTTPPSSQPSTTPLREPDFIARGDEAGPLNFGQELYMCVLTDLTVAQDTWVTAIEVAPQHAKYALRATVNVSRQGNCDALGISANVVFNYRPNNPRLEFAEGDALLLPARSRIAVQIHFDTKHVSDASIDTTLTEVRLWTLPKGDQPSRQVMRESFHAFDITIPVDAVDVEVGTSSAIDVRDTRPAGQIVGYEPEMKYLGQSMNAEVVASDGTRTTLFDFPDWSIDARKIYMLDPGKYVPVASGASLEHSCVYSNRLEDQKLDVRGNPMEPQLTTFGEDERQEMCGVSVYFRYPL